LRIFRWGCLLAVFTAVACVALVVLLVFRPTTVIGVDRDALAQSLESELDNGTAQCRRVSGAEEDRYSCEVGERGSGFRGEPYTLRVSDWGCWETTGGGRRRLDDCIWLYDYADLPTL
jgi:hypothetical protein